MGRIGGLMGYQNLIRGRGVKGDGKSRMPETLRTVETGSVFSDHDDVTS